MKLQDRIEQIVMWRKRAKSLSVFWVTNKKLMEEYEDFFSLEATDKLRFRKNYKQAFRKSDEEGMVPIYDRMEKQEEPIAFLDEKGVKYDIFFDTETMELVPKSAKSTLHLLGSPRSGKTTKILAAPQMLNLISKYYDGFYFEYDYPLDTPERSQIEEKVRSFQKGKLPERDQLGAKPLSVPLKLVWEGKSAAITLAAEAGEAILKSGSDNRAYKSRRDGIILLVSGSELLQMVHGETEIAAMRLMDEFMAYALRMGDFGKDQNFIIVFNQIDKLQEEGNEHLQNVLANNTVGRDEDGHLILHNEGVLDMASLRQMQQEMLLFLKETCPIFYGKLKQIARCCNVEIFVNADLNQEIEGMQYNPEEIVPFRTDEFWLYFLYMNGMAKDAKKIIGVEIIPEAVEDAEFNAVNNQITNARFICSDASDAAKTLAKEKIKPDVIVVDPPRKGCSEALLNTIAKDFSPDRLVYVSCDPATLARDINVLNGLGYALKEYTPFDLFPRTSHVETVALLVKGEDYAK